MNVLSPLIESAWAEQIGWTLVQSVWQIALVAALFALGALALRRSSANARYILGCLALLAMVAWPAATLITMSLENLEQPPSTATVATLPAMSTTAAADAVPFEAAPLLGLDAAPQPSFEVSTHDWAASWEIVVGVARRGLRRLEPALPWAAVNWVVGASLLALRPLRGLIVVRRLKSQGLAPLSTELRKLAGQLMMRLRVHSAVQFAESVLVEVPTVVGYFCPMVLLPASAVTGLSTAQLEMIVAHELAHIRRHDYLVNLLQTVIEALLFYHPGVWWVSAQVRREREHCCDDVAMTVCGNRSEYVRALYTLESRRQASALALAASGGSLVERVRRIVCGPHRANRDDSAAAWWAGLIVLAVVTSVLALGLAYAEESITETAQQDASSEPRTASEASTPTAERATLNGRFVYDGPRPEQPLLRIPLTLSYRRDGEQTETPELPERRRIAELGLKDESLIVGEDGGIANVVVWVRSKDVPAPRWSGPLPPATIRATEGRFEPHVLAFWNLAPLRWINASTEGVNFNWRPAANPGANRLIPAGEEVSIEVPLRRPVPQPTRLTSNIQPWMSAYILPLAHPYFAVTGRDGRFNIEDLPPGTWEFGVWHERTGWLKSDRFETGRFKWTIRAGENSVGDLWVEPATLDLSPNRPAEEPEAETPKRVIRPTPMPPLPTLETMADRSLVDREIDEAFDELQQRREGHVIVGRVLVEGDDDPTLVNAQMEILGGGYFAGVTRDLERPVGFAMHGYEPYLLPLSGKSGPIVDVGIIQLKRLPPEKLIPIVGRMEMEDGGDPSAVEVGLTVETSAINTPSNGTSPRQRWPEPIEVKLDGAGRFYATGFSPTEYYLTVTAPGFVKHAQRVDFRDTDIANLGTIRLERPRWVEIDFVVAREHPIPVDEAKQVRLEGGSRWQITPHPYRWDLEFKQVNGQLRFAWSYGPVYLADLGTGELSDFARVDGGTAQSPPNLVPLRNSHVYLLRRPDWEDGGEDLVLFKIRTNSIERVEPHPRPAQQPQMPKPPADTSLPRTRPLPDGRQPNATDIDRLDHEGFSQLHRAASGGHVDRVRTLLDLGANVNIEQGTYRGTPLQYATFRGHGETVQALLDRGAKVDARDTNGRTPLVWAAMGGHVDVAERLLDAGADINAANAGGWTPLRYAVDRGHESLAQLLIARGANVQATNSQGKLPGDLQPGTAKRAGELVESDRNAIVVPAQVSADVAAAQQRGEASQEPLDPPRQPTDVVATVLGRDITAAEIEPPPQWYAERQKRVEAGTSREYDTSKAYRARQLAGLISGPLFDEYRKQAQLEPTEEQIAEFLRHYQLAKVRSQQERARELAQLREEAVELEARLEAGDLSGQEAARASKRLETVRSQVAIIEKVPKRRGILEDREKQDRFFAEWHLRNWNLQASLYRRYGGRAIWQQAGNEALDAMRDYLREQERVGKFKIHDPSLGEQFWKIYAPEKLLFEIRDPGRVFEHPWSAFEPVDDPS